MEVRGDGASSNRRQSQRGDNLGGKSGQQLSPDKSDQKDSNNDFYNESAELAAHAHTLKLAAYQNS